LVSVLIPVSIFAALVIILQAHSGAWTSDFTADEDEPAHAVSSLMVRDYLVNGIPQNPVRFAENYYLHYPKVAIGHFPPLLYASEALWMLVFGRNRIAMLALIGVCAVALLTSVFLWVKRDYGASAGLVAAAALAAPAFMQTAMVSVAPNVALALLSFWAAVAFGEYLERRRLRDAIVFFIVVLLAIALHGRGAALALIPAAVMFTGRIPWTRVRVMLLMVTAAVTFVALNSSRQAGPFHITALPGNAAFYLYRASTAMSWPVVILAIAGAVVVIRERELPRRSLAMVALVIGAWMFHSIVNAGWSDRYLATAAPGVAALCGAGFHFVREKSAALGGPARVCVAAMAILLCAGLAWIAVPLVRKPDLGYHRLIDVPDAIALVAGSALHEGAFISEMALRDRRLDRIVLRGSKVLASSTWTGRQYQLLFPSTQEVSSYLDAARVEIAVFEEASTQPHVRQLIDTLRADPSRWSVSHLDGQPPGTAIFQRIAALPPGDPVIRLDMHRSLGKTIENK
jgi:hypothetical protein